MSDRQTPSVSEKSQKFEAVAGAIFKILLHGGPKNVTHSAVSRASRVSRAWIYKYIGKSSDHLVEFSLDALGKAFTRLEGLEQQATASEVRKSLFEGTFRMLADAAKDPSLLAIYYRYSGTQNPIGKKIDELERIYLRSVKNRLQKFFGLSARDAENVSEVLQGLRMGLAHRIAVLRPEERLTPAELRKSIQRIFKNFLGELK